MKTKIVFILSVFMVFSLFFAGYSLWGKEQTIKYLPRDEKVDIVSKDLGITLSESTCAVAEDIFKQANDCNYCVNTLKRECPNCCLDTSPRRIKCTQQGNSLLPLAFPVDSCSAVNGKEQSAGCGDPKPNATAGSAKCVDDGTNAWICDKDNLQPTNKGCVPTVGAQTATPTSCPDCTRTIGYNKASITCPASINATQCYRYTLTSGYANCLAACAQYTTAQSGADQAYANCKNGVCPGQGGYNACGTAACQERIARPECDPLTAADCTELTNEATNCLTAADGQCHNCFKPISEDFFYRFVARSREKVVVMWQILSTPEFQAQAPTYFYTMVRIIDDTTNRVVHESIVSQKSFQGSFSIFSATAQSAIRESDKKTILETGKPYRVELCYFIPPLGMGLNIQIDKVQLIIVRTRR